jgi:membrane-bound lytic murein transglycosylase B
MRLFLVTCGALLAAGCGSTARHLSPAEPAARAAAAGATTATRPSTSAAAATTAPTTSTAVTPRTASSAAPPPPRLPRLPIASRWALPPIVRLSAPAHAPAAARRRVLRSAVLALAPAARRAVSRGDALAVLAPLAGLPRSVAPVLVLDARGGTAHVQATSIPATRAVLAALLALPRAARPTILLERATADGADAQGPPKPRPGELASLAPVYVAAGSRYGIDWRVLAAINVVETGLGSNLSTSSAGAVGWMQFMPGTWREYGVDASGDGVADPYDPEDAIYAAARLLQANGAAHDLRRAIFAYNHAWWYVDRVLHIAATLPQTPA